MTTHKEKTTWEATTHEKTTHKKMTAVSRNLLDPVGVGLDKGILDTAQETMADETTA
jgi:hypothetical protein